jgi:hypothetical protein
VLIAPTGYRTLNRPQDGSSERVFNVLANPVVSELATAPHPGPTPPQSPSAGSCSTMNRTVAALTCTTNW